MAMAGAKRKSSLQSARPPVLLILDMNGVLVSRNKNNRSNIAMRPHLQHFVSTLQELNGCLRVAVWSSMMMHNLEPIAMQAFGEFYQCLEFVWDQSHCTQKYVPGMGKPLLRKDLHKLHPTKWGSFVPNRVLLIDDDPIKCSVNPMGTAIHPQSFVGNFDDAEDNLGDSELLYLSKYLRTLVDSHCETVPEFVLENPYSSAEEAPLPVKGPSPFTPPSKKLRSAADAVPADLTKPAVSSRVEVYWPEDDTWLPAQIAKVQTDGQICITWEEDGSESFVPADYVRRAEPPVECIDLEVEAEALPNGTVRDLAAESGWMRMESRRKKSIFYYWNHLTGETRGEPPAPWMRRESRNCAGAIYYWNPVSGATSGVKPDLHA